MSPDDPRHGTYAGGRVHRSEGETVCTPCARAEARYENERLLDRMAGRPRTTSSHGTALRLRALVTLGHTFTRMGEALGVTSSAVARLTTDPPPVIRSSTARRIADLYDAWSMTLPPAGDRWQAKSATYARNIAMRHGWLPPLALDDDRIDDPTYRPRMPADKGVTYDHAVVERVLTGEKAPRTLRHAESAEIVRRARARGYSSLQILALYGIKAERFDREGDPAA